MHGGLAKEVSHRDTNASPPDLNPGGKALPFSLSPLREREAA
jgi:hypothetical protein